MPSLRRRESAASKGGGRMTFRLPSMGSHPRSASPRRAGQVEPIDGPRERVAGTPPGE